MQPSWSPLVPAGHTSHDAWHSHVPLPACPCRPRPCAGGCAPAAPHLLSILTGRYPSAHVRRRLRARCATATTTCWLRRCSRWRRRWAVSLVAAALYGARVGRGKRGWAFVLKSLHVVPALSRQTDLQCMVRFKKHGWVDPRLNSVGDPLPKAAMLHQTASYTSPLLPVPAGAAGAAGHPRQGGAAEQPAARAGDAHGAGGPGGWYLGILRMLSCASSTSSAAVGQTCSMRQPSVRTARPTGCRLLVRSRAAV